LPFFCGDITPREWRVPSNSDTHPNNTIGIAHIRVLTLEQDLPDVIRRIMTVLGSPPSRSSGGEAAWTLHAQNPAGTEPQLILNLPRNDEEHEYVLIRGRGLYEIGFRVNDDEGGVFSPHGYGKVVLIPA